MLIWEGSWPNSLVRRPPWLQACSVKNKQTNKNLNFDFKKTLTLLCTTYKEASGRRQTKKIEAKTRMLNSTPTYFRLSIKHWNTLIYLLICLFSSIPTYTKVGVHPPFADRNKQKSFSGSISLTVVVSSTQNLKKGYRILSSLQNPTNISLKEFRIPWRSREQNQQH